MIREIFLMMALIAQATPLVYSNETDLEGRCAESDKNDCKLSYMEEVVVTGTRTGKKILNSPLSLSLISSQQLLTSTANGIAEILQDLAGISVSDSGTATG